MKVTKRCSECKQFKSLSEFSKRKASKDGLRSCCKSCDNAYQQQYRQTPNGKTYRTEYQKAYQQTPKGKAANSKKTAKYNALNPNHHKAINAVTYAIRTGKLPRPDTLLCHYCPKQAEQYHHYKGYEPEHWLDVVPTCRKCHRKCHSKCN